MSVSHISKSDKKVINKYIEQHNICTPIAVIDDIIAACKLNITKRAMTKYITRKYENTNQSSEDDIFDTIANMDIAHEYPHTITKHHRMRQPQNLDTQPHPSQWIHDIQEHDELDEIHARRTQTVEYLASIEYPEQRSAGWFKMRESCITASDGGTAIGVNKYEPQFKFILKKVVGAPFNSNKFCYHGKKFEKVATMIYEYRANVQTLEFGLVIHKQHKFLGASPDGIVGAYKHNGEHRTNMVGRMLEIKCPLARDIKQTGEIKDHICPIYYWVQVQLQLECCDLDECDFWQCKLFEYDSRDDFINDTNNREPYRSKTSGFEKGCLIQMIPKDMADVLKDRSNQKYLDVIWDKAAFIYPDSIEMTPLECDTWTKQKISTLETDYPGYVFDKVIYWRLDKSSCVLIERDTVWFANNLPILRKIWDSVEYYRANSDMTAIMLEYIESLNVKSNKKIMNVINDLILAKDEPFRIDTINKEIKANKRKKLDADNISNYVDQSDVIVC